MNSILAWFAEIIPIPQDEDLFDGAYIYRLLQCVDQSKFPPLDFGSPIKIYAGHVTIRNLSERLNVSLDSIKLTQGRNQAEFKKLISAVVKFILEYPEFVAKINNLQKDEINDIVEFIDGPKIEDNTQGLLTKIDELEDENQQLRSQLEAQNSHLEEQNRKLSQSEQHAQNCAHQVKELREQLNNVQENSHSEETITELKSQLTQMVRELQSTVFERDNMKKDVQQLEYYKNQHQQLQQQLQIKVKVEKQAEELKSTIQILKTQVDSKDELIKKLQSQIKSLNIERTKDANQIIQLELQFEQQKQQIINLENNYSKELFDLKQQILEVKEQETSHDLSRSNMQSPKYLDQELMYDSQNETFINELIKQHQLKELMYTEQIKTLQTEINRIKQNNIQNIQKNARLDEQNKKLQQDLENLADENYQVNEIKEQRQINMLLTSLIESFKCQQLSVSRYSQRYDESTRGKPLRQVNK